MEEETEFFWCSGTRYSQGHKTALDFDDDLEEAKKPGWTCIHCLRWEHNFPHSPSETRSCDIVSEIRPWGAFSVLDEGLGYKAKRIEVLPGKRLSLQWHKGRVEHWTCVAGAGKFTVGSEEVVAIPGTSVVIDVEQVHRMENTGERLFVVIEVQRGNCDEADIFRVSDDFGRADGNGPA